MDTGYQMEPERIGRTRSRRVPVLVGAAALALAVTIVKPWAGASPTPVKPVVGLAAVASASPGPIATVDPAIIEPRWPAFGFAVEPPLASTEPTPSLAAFQDLRGTWGVGATGIGPRLSRDGPWSDWAAVGPERLEGPDAQAESPRHTMVGPGSSLCPGVPMINDHPSVVVITMPTTIRTGATFAGWWTDGGRSASIDESVRLLPIDDEAGIAVVERIDSAQWPVGLYEFQVRSRDRTFDLTVCMTRGD